jgi:hypothetical protein
MVLTLRAWPFYWPLMRMAPAAKQYGDFCYLQRSLADGKQAVKWGKAKDFYEGIAKI